MGTKLANIQVRENNLDLVEKAFKEYLENCKKDSMGYFFSTMYQCYPFYIGQVRENWVTILHCGLEWGNVGEVTFEFSKYFSGVVMAVGYYDDDVFGLSLVEGGKVLTQHISGEGADYYASGEIKGDIDLFIHKLMLDVKHDELKGAFEQADLEQEINCLENIFDTVLWIKADWLDNLEETISNKFKTI